MPSGEGHYLGVHGMMRIDASSDLDDADAVKRKIARHLQGCAGPSVLIVDDLSSSSSPVAGLLSAVLAEISHTGKLVYNTIQGDLVVDVGRMLVLVTSDAGADVVIKEFVKGSKGRKRGEEGVIKAMEDKFGETSGESE